MAITNNSPISKIMLLLVFLFAAFCISGVQSIGVCYGRLGNNLPPPHEVVALYRSNNIDRMRIYDPDHNVLNALRGSNIHVMIGVPNSDLQKLTNYGEAQSWVQNNVVRFWPAVRIRYIAVGNEVSPIHNPGEARTVLPALVNVFNAIRAAGLNEQIRVSTAIDTTLIGKSYPPSQGAFRGDIRWFLDPIVGHLAWAKTPLLANIYTYFSYQGNPQDISLPYALFTSPNIVFHDNGKAYQNLFDAMLDSLYSALEAWGNPIEVVVSESGWPSAGGFGTSFDNAKAYVSNLIKHVKVGTPKRPQPIEAYIFAMFNENQKSGPELEKNFGLFFPDKRPKYNIGFGGERDVDDMWDISETNATIIKLPSDDM